MLKEYIAFNNDNQHWLNIDVCPYLLTKFEKKINELLTNFMI